MGEAGIFHEDDRVELIDGEVMEMSPIGWRHVWCVRRLIQVLARSAEERTASGDHYELDAQDPINLASTMSRSRTSYSSGTRPSGAYPVPSR